MLRKGFTLIELLIVVTIIAILAGAAVPYVQDYVEESRRARARADLDQVSNALALYEVRRGQPYPNSSIASLVGPFLTKALVDPWGAPYEINEASSTVISYGQDGVLGTFDDLEKAFRPRMSMTKAQWIDTNGDGVVTVGDSIHFYFTRPLNAALTTANTNNNSTYGPAKLAATFALAGNPELLVGGKVASIGFNAVFTPGAASASLSTTNQWTDRSLRADNMALSDVIRIVAP
jgi:general secretion pathway protein G